MIRKLQWIRLIIACCGLIFVSYVSISGNQILLPYANGIFIVLMAVFTMLLSAEMRIKGQNTLLTYFLFFFSIAMFYVTLKTQFGN